MEQNKRRHLECTKKENKKTQEINNLVNKLIELRNKPSKESSGSKYELIRVQNECIQKLDYLVKARTKKYKNFPNYDDLCQDGRLALHSALRTYKPGRGCFFWWANKYIKTRVSRAANCHSTIKIPIHKTKTTQPYKVSQLPVIVDNQPDPFEGINSQERGVLLRQAIEKLPETQRKVIELHYEIDCYNRRDSNSIINVSQKLDISRANCIKLLKKARKNLKKELKDLGV